MWKLKSELHEEILEKLYQHRDTGEFLTLTEVFDTVSFEQLYEKVQFLQRSKLIEFYTAPSAYAVFKEPDFIRAKIRTEGIQYCKDNYSLLRKPKTFVSIIIGALALVVGGYVINTTIIQNHSVSSENSSSPQPSSSVPDDSIATKLKDTLSGSPTFESRPSIRQDTAKPDKLIEQANDQPIEPSKTESQDQIGEIDLKNNYTIELDTLNHLIKVSPKVGKWDSTVLAIPLNEMEFVQPEFQSLHKVLNGGDFTFDALGQKFSGIISTETLASGDQYSFHYVNKPTIFIFGNYPNTLYPYYFAKSQ